LAARAIFEALKRGDTSASSLAAYDRAIAESYIIQDLHRRRNMRLAFQKFGFFGGGAAATLMILTGGRFPGWRFSAHRDTDHARRVVVRPPFVPDGKLT